MGIINKRFPLALACFFLLSTQALAHEFILKPKQSTEITKGETIAASLLSAHVFMESVELEGEGDAQNILVRYIDASGTKTLPLTKNEAQLTWDLNATAKTDGTAIFAAHRKGMIWTQTTKGWKQASKKGLKGVLSSGKYEKFAKSLVTVGNNTKGWDRVVGDRLEIVPMSDPSTLRPGQELAVKILLDGKPLATPVYASYDKFSNRQDTYAYFSKDNQDGTAFVKISAAGLWMIRAEHIIKESTPDYDKHVMRAVFVFEVK